MEWYNWLLSVFLFIVIPFSVIVCRLMAIKALGKKGYNKKYFVISLIKNTCFYWLLGAFHLCAIFSVLLWTFIFGGIAMVIIFYNLANAFVRQNERGNTLNKIGLLQDFIVGIILTVYLIYIIPEKIEGLQTIVTAIVAALYGGLLTLVGVAWTIRHDKEERKIVESKHIEERKEEERKRFIPYLKVTIKEKGTYTAHFSVNDEVIYEDLVEGKEQTAYAVSFAEFSVKNISSAVIVLVGIEIANKFHKFDNEYILGKDDVLKICKIGSERVGFLALPESLTLKVRDAIGNGYSLDCSIERDLASTTPQGYGNGHIHYTYYLYNYAVVGLSLPKLLQKRDNK